MRPQLEDADKGMTGLFVYPVVLLAVFYPFRFTLAIDEIGDVINNTLLICAIRLAPLGLYLFFCEKRVFFAFRAAVDDGQRTLSILFGAFLLLSWIPIMYGAQSQIILKVVEPVAGEEPLIQALFETFVSIATVMAEGTIPAFAFLGFAALVNAFTSIIDRDSDPYYQMYELSEQERKRRDRHHDARMEIHL